MKSLESRTLKKVRIGVGLNPKDCCWNWEKGATFLCKVTVFGREEG